MRHKGLPRSKAPTSHHDLAALAERQHGVVSIRQLRGPLGYSPNAISRASAAGRLHRVHRGVYAVGHRRLTAHGWCLAAVLACGPGALLSHGSAAWLWGLLPRGPVPPAVTTPVPRKARRSIRMHHSRTIAPADKELLEGIPVTALPRTLLDHAASSPRRRLERTLERAEELRLFDLGPVESVLARNAGHAGAGRLRRALTLYVPPPFTRSQLERNFLVLVQDAGLPRPISGFVEAGYELDAYWPAERFAVELDIFETHGTRAAFERDRLRQEDLKLAGIEMTRVTGPRLAREPERVVERLGRLLAQRRVQFGA